MAAWEVRNMSEMAVEPALATNPNGGPDPLGLDPKATVLAREDSLSGKLALKGTGQVLGNFSGQIESDGDLWIGPEAHVEADIRGARITVSGLVRGNVIATSRLKITSSGRLEGDATVGALVVQEGGVHSGGQGRRHRGSRSSQVRSRDRARSWSSRPRSGPAVSGP